MADPLRIVIADDDHLVREGTRQLLEATGEVTVLAAVGDADQLLDATTRLAPGRRWVVLSRHADEGYAFELLRHGTAGLGHLLEERVGESAELVRALVETAAGRSVIDPLVIDALVGRRLRVSSPLQLLTDRELAVLARMAPVRTNQAIADTVALSRSAVEKHITAIFAEPGLAEEARTRRRVAAVLTCLRDAGSEVETLMSRGGSPRISEAQPGPGQGRPSTTC